ncbi:MAG: hypothetical protein JSS65_09185 [Armatimonadetes bacterium]|nr:hypothetical protein [Armatimonadota bacterium]
MKLNLLPTHVATQSKAPVFAALGATFAVLAIGGAVFLQVSSQADLKDAKEKLASSKQGAADALATANHAEEISKKGEVINTNLMLAKAMFKHNSAYVELYESIMPYIPDFYRVTSMTASPGGADTSTVTLVGQIESFRKYADVALAFWRTPGVTNVTRAGFQLDDPSRGPITETDQSGSVVKPGEQPLPSDPLDKMDAIIARANSAPEGYLNTGNFGQDGGVKGPMPGWSTVTIVLTVSKDLRTPDPRSTLGGSGGGGGGGIPGARGPGGPGGGFPGGPPPGFNAGGPPGAGPGVGAPPSNPGAGRAPAGGGGRGRGDDD